MFANRRPARRHSRFVPACRKLTFDLLERREYPGSLLVASLQSLLPALLAPGVLGPDALVESLVLKSNGAEKPEDASSIAASVVARLPGDDEGIFASNAADRMFRHDRQPGELGLEETADLKTPGSGSAAGEGMAFATLIAGGEVPSLIPQSRAAGYEVESPGHLLDAHGVSQGDVAALLDGHNPDLVWTPDHVSWRPAAVQWPDMQMTVINYFIDTSDHGAGTMPQLIVNAAHGAAFAWNNVHVGYSFSEVAPPSAVDPGSEDVRVQYTPDSSPCAGAFACTQYNPSSAVAGIFGGDLHHWHRWQAIQNVNFAKQLGGADINWVDGGAPGYSYHAPDPDVDAQTIATHEFGHVSGLGHDPVGSGTVMEIYYNYGVVRRTPTDFDRYGVFHLYSDTAGPPP